MKLIPYNNLQDLEIWETFMVDSALIFFSKPGDTAKGKTQNYRTHIRNRTHVS